MTYTDAFKEAYASVDNTLIHLESLELRHALFAPVRVVRDSVSLTATLEASAPVDASTEVTFISMDFNVELPEKGGKPDPRLTVALDNVSGLLTPYLQSIADGSDVMEMTFRAWLFDPSTGTATGPDGIINAEVLSVTSDRSRVVISAAIPNAANLAFPSELITPDVFPGLVI